MARRSLHIFRYHCPKCGGQNTATCKSCGTLYRLDLVVMPGEKRVKRPIGCGERQWQRAVARAIVTPGVGPPSELVRMALDEILAMPPHRTVSS